MTISTCNNGNDYDDDDYDDDGDDGDDVSVNKCNMNPCIILIRKVPALKDIDSQSLFILKYEF